MKVLEKILEEIEDEIRCYREILYDGRITYGIASREAYKRKGIAEGLQKAMQIIRSHMGDTEAEPVSNPNKLDDGWITWDRKNLPPEGELVEVTIKPKILKTPRRDIGYYDRNREEWWKYDDDGLMNVIAWKMPAAPYQPKED